MLHSVGVLDDLRRYRELKSVDNVIENYLLVTVVHHGWKEEGSWRGSMERGDGEGGWQQERCQKVAEWSGGSNGRGVRVKIFV